MLNAVRKMILLTYIIIYLYNDKGCGNTWQDFHAFRQNSNKN